MAKVRSQFDRAYYERFYGDPRTRVSDRAEDLKLARFVLGYLDYLGVRIKTVLDLGCGTGRWRSALEALQPDIEYTGVEISEAMCEEHGWIHGSVADYDGPPADLVVCHGVLQYLDDASAKRALENLGRLSDKAMYLETVTKEDWDNNVDQELTDGEIHFRRIKWYRRRLSEHFESAGGGLFLPHRSPVVLFELERGAP